MSYLGAHRRGLGVIDLNQSIDTPWGGLPGPPLPIGPIGPQGPAASIFPTNLAWGDVAMISGSFQGVTPGSLRVKFEGAGWLAPMPLGPFSASVVVPEGAQTGACMIEVDGRVVYGSQCTITPRAPIESGRTAYPKEPARIETWKDFGPSGPLGFIPGIGDITSNLAWIGAAAVAFWFLKLRKKRP